MVKVYAIVLAVGVVLLLGWIFATAFASNENKPRLDPETRFGMKGRRVVAALVGFGMAGMSAEFSPRDLSWQIGLLLAVVGGSVAAWYAVWIDRPRPGRSASDSG